MTDKETVETALIKILDRALAISDNEICNKIPKIVEKRASYIVDNVIKDLRKKSEDLKKEMVKQFRQDIKKSLSADISNVAKDYKKIFYDLTDNAIRTETPNRQGISEGISEGSDAKTYVNSVQKFANNGKGDAVERIQAVQPIIMYISEKEKKTAGMGSNVAGALKTVAKPFIVLGKISGKITWMVTKTVIGAIITATTVLAAANPLLFISLIATIKEIGPEKFLALTMENAPTVFKAQSEIIDLLNKNGPAGFEAIKKFTDVCVPLIQSGGEDFMKLINSPEFSEATIATTGFVKEYGPEFLDVAVNTGEFLTKFEDDLTILDSFPEMASGVTEFGTESLQEATLNGPKFLAENAQMIKAPSIVSNETISDLTDNMEDFGTEAASMSSGILGLAKNTLTQGGGGKLKKKRRYSKKTIRSRNRKTTMKKI